MADSDSIARAYASQQVEAVVAEVKRRISFSTLSPFLQAKASSKIAGLRIALAADLVPFTISNLSVRIDVISSSDESSSTASSDSV